jgi:hypothetical protein
MDFLSVHLLVAYAFFNLFLFFQKSSKFFMRGLTHKTSQVLTRVGWILKNDLDIQPKPIGLLVTLMQCDTQLFLFHAKFVAFIQPSYF